MKWYWKDIWTFMYHNPWFHFKCSLLFYIWCIFTKCYHYLCIFIWADNHTHKSFRHIDDSIICKYGIWIKIHFAKILEQCNKWSTLQLTIQKGCWMHWKHVSLNLCPFLIINKKVCKNYILQDIKDFKDVLGCPMYAPRTSLS
jgi:hypothetical protein